MARPRLLDLFCGAGGAAMGYHRAGFDVVGVDIRPQPNYPYEFIQGDALEVLDSLRFFADEKEACDAIHASPPCQAHVKGMAAANRALGRAYDHVDLIGPTRELLIATGLPYVIENVVGAPLRNWIMLCGSSFGLDVRRHRLFETSFGLMASPCAHYLQRERKFWTSTMTTRARHGKHGATVAQVYGAGGDRHTWGPAMGIDWMTGDELAEAIPPAYTEFIGQQLVAHLARVAA